MNILFLTHSYGEQGTYWRCFHLGRYLAKKGHKVTIIARGAGYEAIRSSKWRVDTIFLPSWRTQWLKRLPLIFGMNIDLIHVSAAANFCNSIPGLFAKLKGVRMLVDWDDWWTRGGFVPDTPLTTVKTIMEEKLPLLASAVTVVSDALWQRALNCGVKEKDLFKIENGSNVEDIRIMTKGESRKKLKLDNMPTIMYLGRWGTDVQFLLHAVKQVRNELGDVRLMVVGLQGRSTEAVSFVGHVSYDRVQYYLAAADVLCMPMDNDLVGRARWPIKFGDYMASGRPIVGSDVGEVGRILREVDSSLVSDPGKPSDMATRIIQLLKDESYSIELGSKIRRLAEMRYSWGLIAEKLEAVYGGIMP